MYYLLENYDKISKRPRELYSIYHSTGLLIMKLKLAADSDRPILIGR